MFFFFMQNKQNVKLTLDSIKYYRQSFAIFPCPFVYVHLSGWLHTLSLLDSCDFDLSI